MDDPAGCVAGVAASWQGSVGGKVIVELNVRWRKGQTLDPDWKIDQDGWVIQIDGRPTVTANISFLPPPDFEAETIADFMVLGHIMTAAPPINAIPAVVAAAPGIATYNDLPLVLPPRRHMVLGQRAGSPLSARWWYNRFDRATDPNHDALGLGRRSNVADRRCGAELGPEPVGPLEVVEQAPNEIPAYVHTVVEGAPHTAQDLGEDR